VALDEADAGEAVLDGDTLTQLPAPRPGSSARANAVSRSSVRYTARSG
jgi:hypothetical protein